jgi:hypothetical protein
MNTIIPIVSKQIAFVQYDEQAAKMIVQYHTGRTQAFTGVNPNEYQTILSSTNGYDFLVKLTRSRLPDSSFRSP